MGLLRGIDFSACKHRFVVQLHDAERAGRHFDLRLEAYDNESKQCVLVSWATRKLDQLMSSKVSRVGLFRTEDHELKWLTFKGEIRGGYGKGIVKILDKGQFEVIEDKQDVLAVKFLGEVLSGSYAFVKLSNENFLLVKMKSQSEFNMAASIYPYACLFCRRPQRLRRIRRVRRFRNEVNP